MLFDRVQKKLKKRGIQKKMSMERKEAKVDEVFGPYFESLKKLKVSTERVLEFKPELKIDRESLFYPRDDEPELSRMEKIRLRVLTHLEEICKILGNETGILDEKEADDLRVTTEKLDKLFREMVSVHPDKRKIIETSLEEERERLKEFAVERREFLDDVVGGAR